MNIRNIMFSRIQKIALVAGICSAAFPLLASAKVSFSLYPAAATLSPNGYMSVGLYVTNTGDPINAVSGLIDFPTDKLQAVSLDTSDSIAGLWVDQPKISAENGTVNFGGIIFNPGFSGNLGKVLSIRFKAIGSGPAQIQVSSPQALANDGQGTNVPVSGQASAAINITSLAQNGTVELSSADRAANILPSALITSRPGSASAVAQGLGLVLIIFAIMAAFYNSFMIRGISRKLGKGGAMTQNEADLIKKLKKDIRQAEGDEK